MKTESHLAVLMKQLQITGKEMACALHMDVTLISKYRNGKRKLLRNLAEEIAEYVLQIFCINYPSAKQDLRVLLEEYGHKSIMAYSDEELKFLLTEYLLEDYKDEVIYIEQEVHEHHKKGVVDFYTGYEGWAKAYEDFTNAVCDNSEEPETNEVFIGDYQAIDFERTENYQLYLHADKMCKRMLQAGRKIILLTTVKKRYQSYAILLNWLQLYANDNVEAYYIEDFQLFENKECILVQPGRIAFSGKDTDRTYSPDIYIVTREQIMVNYYYAVCQVIRSHSIPLVHKIRMYNQKKLHKTIQNVIYQNRLIYIIDTMPSYRNMPEALLLEILTENGIEGELRQECIDDWDLWQEFYTQNECKCNYDIESIEANLKKEKIKDIELSVIVGKEIWISRKQFIQHLQFLTNTSMWKDEDIAFSQFSKMELAYDYITMMVQGDNLLLMWSAHGSPNCLQFTEPSLVGGCRRYVKEMWNNLPVIYRNRKLLWERLSYSDCDEVILDADRRDT